MLCTNRNLFFSAPKLPPREKTILPEKRFKIEKMGKECRGRGSGRRNKGEKGEL